MPLSQGGRKSLTVSNDRRPYATWGKNNSTRNVLILQKLNCWQTFNKYLAIWLNVFQKKRAYVLSSLAFLKQTLPVYHPNPHFSIYICTRQPTSIYILCIKVESSSNLIKKQSIINLNAIKYRRWRVTIVNNCITFIYLYIYR